MDAGISEFFEWGFKGLIGVLGMIGLRHVSEQSKQLGEISNSVSRVSQDTAAVSRELQDHKLHVADNYAKEQTMQTSLGRIHERIDKMNDRIDDGFNTMNTKIDASMESINRNIQTMAANRK